MSAGRSHVTNLYQTPNAIYIYPGSETMWDKLHSQKEKSPNHQLRSPMIL